MSALPSSKSLGLLPHVSLTPGQARSFEVLACYDLTRPRQRLLRDHPTAEPWADAAFFEFRRFLGLRLLTPEPQIMFSSEVDEVWHTCLLFTRLYVDLCQQVFGGYFHHDPLTAPDPLRARKYAAFVALYSELYGPLSPLWHPGRTARCG